MKWQKASEKELREAEEPRPKSLEELTRVIDALVEREHDYGTCVYAMSIAATAAFNYVASKLGVTGFQASCADMDVLRRLRGWERFRVVNMGNLLYPQYRESFEELEYDRLLAENRAWLAEQAKEKLASLNGESLAHPDVVAHWKRLAAAA